MPLGRGPRYLDDVSWAKVVIFANWVALWEQRQELGWVLLFQAVALLFGKTTMRRHVYMPRHRNNQLVVAKYLAAFFLQFFLGERCDSKLADEDGIGLPQSSKCADLQLLVFWKKDPRAVRFRLVRRVTQFRHQFGRRRFDQLGIAAVSQHYSQR